MTLPFDPKPVTLEGTHARLEPLALAHAAGLLEAGREEELWLYLFIPPLRTLDDARIFIERALADARNGSQIPFAIIDRKSGSVAGSTRYLDIRRPERGLEIGWTWLGAAARRTAINTECKYLLLRHAFEAQGAIRVQIKTDARNLRSQRAIERIGGVREGVLRRHMIRPYDGFVRDTVMFSIIDTEWPTVKTGLEDRLGR
ncbi:N-acetyltransferase [bacterium]|nr:MAG: N-acetyltransferase [bacterium]